MSWDVVDLFGGPGGWSLACRWLGLSEIGVELDPYAVATRHAAGFDTLVHDLSSPVLPYGPTDVFESAGIIASPPCQSFSKAGSGSGARQRELVIAAIEALGQVRWPGEHIRATNDPRTVLVLTPLVWALRVLPSWLVLEQVPPVLPIWEAMGAVLADHGYSVAAGLVHAEQYGVPQTRTRAVLLASRRQAVALPTPTHSRFHMRSPERLDPDVLPWVSMAEALGWGADDRRLIPTNLRPNVAARAPNQPAPTMAFGHEVPRWVSAEELAMYRVRVARIAEERVNNQSGVDFDLAWPADRPAPTVAGRELVGMPGANANRHNGRTKSRNDGIRVTPTEAGVLQSFPEDFPWSGPITRQYQQVGNAVPPLLAMAILKEVT